MGPTALQQPQLASALLRQAPARARTAPRRCVTTAGVRKVNTYDESWKKVRADACAVCDVRAFVLDAFSSRRSAIFK